MNKNRVRLTESDLHRIIKESVKKVLSEADWKTFANAEKEARKRGDMSYWREQGETDPKALLNKAVDSRARAGRFGQYAKEKFNKEHGYKNGDMWDDDFASVKMGGDFDATEEFAPHAIGLRSKGYGNPKKYEFGRDNDTFQKVSPEEFFQGNDDAAQAFKKANDEVKNWKSGKSKYVKGKGWK